MNTETINSLKELLLPVAEKIGQTAEWGWAIVIKQMYVEAIIAFIVLFLGIGLAIIAYKISKGADFKSDEDPKAWATLIIGIASALFITIGFGEITLGGGIGKLINPEFYAIEFFIGLVK